MAAIMTRRKDNGNGSVRRCSALARISSPRRSSCPISFRCWKMRELSYTHHGKEICRQKSILWTTTVSTLPDTRNRMVANNGTTVRGRASHTDWATMSTGKIPSRTVLSGWRRPQKKVMAPTRYGSRASKRLGTMLSTSAIRRSTRAWTMPIMSSFTKDRPRRCASTSRWAAVHGSILALTTLERARALTTVSCSPTRASAEALSPPMPCASVVVWAISHVAVSPADCHASWRAPDISVSGRVLLIIYIAAGEVPTTTPMTSTAARVCSTGWQEALSMYQLLKANTCPSSCRWPFTVTLAMHPTAKTSLVPWPSAPLTTTMVNFPLDSHGRHPRCWPRIFSTTLRAILLTNMVIGPDDTFGTATIPRPVCPKCPRRSLRRCHTRTSPT